MISAIIRATYFSFSDFIAVANIIRLMKGIRERTDNRKSVYSSK